MTWFITRVELHSATAADYQTLHEAMLGQKFHRNVLATDGVSYELPTAMYFSESWQLNEAGVRDLAVLAANKTGRKFSVFTCQTPSWASHALARA